MQAKCQIKNQEELHTGFGPICSRDSQILILGSFPSVKSRKVEFFYGNKQNRFWSILEKIYHEKIFGDVDCKKEFLLRRKIALWDVVAECYVVGSSDSSIKATKIADIAGLLKECDNIKQVFCNGVKSFELLKKYFSDIASKAVLLPSTSPANVRFEEKQWIDALQKYAE